MSSSTPTLTLTLALILVFQAMDADDDRSITLDEFAAYIARNLPVASPLHDTGPNNATVTKLKVGAIAEIPAFKGERKRRDTPVEPVPQSFTPTSDMRQGWDERLGGIGEEEEEEEEESSEEESEDDGEKSELLLGEAEDDYEVVHHVETDFKDR